MATKTTNLELVKPDYSESADIGVINANMEIIDGAIKSLRDTVTTNESKITALQDSVSNFGSDFSTLSDAVSQKAGADQVVTSITRSGTNFTARNQAGEALFTFTQQDNDTTYQRATTSSDGLMSMNDKQQLAGVAGNVETLAGYYETMQSSISNLSSKKLSGAYVIGSQGTIATESGWGSTLLLKWGMLPAGIYVMFADVQIKLSTALTTDKHMAVFSVLLNSSGNDVADDYSKVGCHLDVRLSGNSASFSTCEVCRLSTSSTFYALKGVHSGVSIESGTSYLRAVRIANLEM